jgi:hypothetical protein
MFRSSDSSREPGTGLFKKYLIICFCEFGGKLSAKSKKYDHGVGPTTVLFLLK